MRFNKYFKVARNQFELDFINVDLDKDLPLFIDPWLLRVEPGVFAKKCRETIRSFFSHLLVEVKSGNKQGATEMLLHLHEPSETRLGFSKGGVKGLAIGMIHAEQIYNALVSSRALKTGLLEDIEDTALFIEGIDKDKVSDLVTNVIRGHLVEYTKQQCLLLGVPMYRVSAGLYWDFETEQWNRCVAELPIYKGSIIVLVPKTLVSRSLQLDPKNFYNKEFLVFEQERHLSAGSGLCRLLKNKEIKPPTKKILKEKTPYTKDLIQNFSIEHKDILNKYKKAKMNEAVVMTSRDIVNVSSENITQPQAARLLFDDLQSILPGWGAANKFQDIILKSFVCIFDGWLTNPTKEHEINEGRKRIDIAFLNNASNGFFSDLTKLAVACKKIYIECKNYTEDLKNGEIDQLIGRMDNGLTKVGFVVCRNINDEDTLLKRCRDAVRQQRNFIIVLTDENMKFLLEARLSNDTEAINDFLEKKLAELL